jgi:uncharacterized protein YndB with AHSA1/START domain
MDQSSSITLELSVNAPVEKVWECWNSPADIMQWNNPSDEWHNPTVENDVRVGGGFFFRMEAKDGSDGFDFRGTYDKVLPHALMEYTTVEGRKSIITFRPEGNGTHLTETFEPEPTLPSDMQRDFVQAILNNFRRYVESGV